MEAQVARAIDGIWQRSWFVLALVGIHIGYYIYSGMGYWDGWGGITSYGLDRSGALVTAKVDNGDFWRLWASLFLHVGLLHLSVNMLNLYCLATLVEGIYGRVRMLLVYCCSGLSGSILTWGFATERTVGASGAIFGLIGLLLIFGWKYHENLQGPAGSFLRKQLAFWSVVSLALGFIIPMIDNAAHVGGLIAGMVGGVLLNPKTEVSQ